MISNHLLKELKEILESVQGRKFSDSEVEETARLYIGYFDLARKIDERHDFELEELQKGFYVWKNLRMP